MKHAYREKALAVVALAWSLASFGATTWYANVANKSGTEDGMSEATGFVKIQDAVDRAADGDTVIVLPGTYGEEQGARPDYSVEKDGVTYTSRSRVVIGRNITLKSRDGADATHVVGRWHDAAAGVAVGENAVRAIAITNETGAVVQGFTVRDSSTVTSAVNIAPAYGGGIAGPFTVAGLFNAFAVDCVVSNCVSSRGGAMSYASAVRTLFVGNGTMGSYLLRACNAYNCVFMYNGSNYGQGGSPAASDAASNSVVGEYVYVVNCTFVANGGPAISSGNEYVDSKYPDRGCYNCLAILNANTKDGQSVKPVNTTPEKIVKIWDSLVGGTNGVNEEDGVRSVGDMPYILADSANGDFRPVAGSGADGAGKVAWLEKIPAAYRDADFYGKPRQAGGKVTLGAVQDTVALQGGRILIPANDSMSAVTANGKSPKYAIPAFADWPFLADEWPKQVELGVGELPDGKELFCWIQSGAWSIRRFADENNLARFTLPKTGIVTNALQLAKKANIIYADPRGSNDNDGSCPYGADLPAGVGPKKTLQAAADKAMGFGSSVYSVIHAAAGDYDAGGVLSKEDPNYASAGWATRLYIGNYHVLVRGAGRDKSVIVGQRDKSEIGQANYGCGPDAIRCVALRSSSSGRSCCVAGFTLKDGCVSTGASDASGPYVGGGFFGYGPHTQLIDCTVTNCAGSRGAALHMGWWQRCLVVDNHNENVGNSFYREGYASSCIFRRNTKPGSRFAHSPYAFYHCLFDENLTYDIYDVSRGALRLYDNVMVSSGSKLVAMTNSFFGGNWQNWTKDTVGWTRTADLKLAAAAEGDYRPLADSPLVTGGAAGSEGDENTYAEFAFEDYCGRTLCFVDGKPIAGPYQRSVYTVRPSGTVSGDISPTGDILMEQGDSVTFTSPNATGKRQFLGYAENGKMVSSGSPSYTYTMSSALYPDKVVELRALYNTNWYVNAGAEYTDTNDGWTPETARHSLVEAVRDAVAGDVIHAAEGVYDEKSAIYPGKTVCPARVVLTNRVTLVADGDVAKTVIKGQLDATEGDDEKRGPNGIRCATLCGNSRLVGFTLTDGRSGKATDNTEPNNAGGVYSDGCVVSDCVITNCCAVRFAAAQNTVLVRCRILDNRAAINGNATGGGSLYGCYLDGNNGKAGWLVNSTADIIGCTITANNKGEFSAMASTRMIDTVCLCPTRATSLPPEMTVISNCVLISTCDVKAKAEGENVTVESGETVIDGNGVPLLNGEAIDKGVIDPTLNGYANGRDAYGTQRVYNGAQDIGAFERDWRGDYSARIGGSVTVTEASPEVKDTAKGVYLPSGSVAFTLPAALAAARYHVDCEVTGDGLCEGTVNDGEPVVFAKGKRSFRAQMSGGDLLRFTYAEAEDDTGGAYLTGFGRSGLLMVVR